MRRRAARPSACGPSPHPDQSPGYGVGDAAGVATGAGVAPAAGVPVPAAVGTRTGPTIVGVAVGLAAGGSDARPRSVVTVAVSIR